jgi:hypothetical protein
MDIQKISDIFYDNTDKIIICKEKEINGTMFPLLVIHETGFYIFFDGNISGTWEKKEAIENVYKLQLFFNTSRLNFYIYGIDEENAYYIDPFSDDITMIFMRDDKKGLEEHILGILQSGSYTIDENKMYYYKEKLNQMTNKGEKIKTDEDGNTYIRRGNNWYMASSDDPDEMFRYTLFGGLFGLHKFKQGKRSAGIGYLLTAGMLCIGWYFDMLAFVLGVAKDPEGLHYLPVSDKKKKTIILLCCIPLSLVILKAYMFLLIFLSNGLSNILIPFISSLV